MVMPLLLDIVKVFSFQGSVVNCNLLSAPMLEGHLPQYSFAKPKASTNMLLLCKCLLPPAHYPRKALELSSALQLWASHVQRHSFPVPQVHISVSHQIQNNDAQCFTGLCILWRELCLRHNMILQLAFNYIPRLCRHRCGIPIPQH